MPLLLYSFFFTLVFVSSGKCQFTGIGGFGQTPTVYTFSDGTTLSSYHTELTKDDTRNGRDDVVSVVIGNWVTSFGRDAFAWCNSLSSITIPNNVSNIGEGALAGTGISTINIPNSVTNIGVSAFQACTALSNIVIPNSVTTLNRYAFLGCTNLSAILIGSGVTNIGPDVFLNCTNLTSVTFLGDAPVSEGDWTNCPATIYRKASSTGWGSTFAGRPVIIEEWDYFVLNGETVITGYSGTNAIITIPSSLNGNPIKKIQTYSFYNSSSLTGITIPKTVTSIEAHAFENCTNLNSVTIESGGFLDIGENVFKNCTSLTSVDFGNSVTSIGNSAFYQCSSLTSLIIPNSVTNIGTASFAACTSLTNIMIPNSVISIGNAAFSGCMALTNATIPHRFLLDYDRMALDRQIAGLTLVQTLANSLATNSLFISKMAQAILSASNNYGLATKTEVGGAVTLGVQQVLSAPSEYNLFTTQQVQDERAAGQNDVLNTPNAFSLYTTNQIHTMGLGGIVLNRDTNNQLTLNYQVMQSADLQNWSPYQTYQLPITNAPTNKMFLRVQAVGQ